jgi:hypothetical protein
LPDHCPACGRLVCCLAHDVLPVVVYSHSKRILSCPDRSSRDPWQCRWSDESCRPRPCTAIFHFTKFSSTP